MPTMSRERTKMDILGSMWVPIFFVIFGAAGTVLGIIQANKSERLRADFERALRERPKQSRTCKQNCDKLLLAAIVTVMPLLIRILACLHLTSKESIRFTA